jgi:tetratricopeptide (TPR) repeat protein
MGTWVKSGNEASGARPRSSGRGARTRLEQLIKDERGETFEEFVIYVEEFTRRHKLAGTLSLRHLLRLVAGRNPDGTPLGPPRPATAKLLERIFGLPISELLAPPTGASDNGETAELRQRLTVARHVDRDVIGLLREQLSGLRRLDRQMGAIVAYPEVRQKIEQVCQLHAHSLTPGIRADLARLLSELGALAGWESLDRHAINQAWDHHESAKQAAREADSSGLLAHATAQQALILADLGEVRAAVGQLDQARMLVERTAPALLRAWLAAAHGEGLAAAGRRDEALRAFDMAGKLLPANPVNPMLPFLFLEGSHLDRWRGHALARLGDAEAVRVLTGALERLDPTFTRAETALRVDLATALVATGERDEARVHSQRAEQLATEIGSNRQRRRLQAVIAL